jgi:hypothetical protein
MVSSTSSDMDISDEDNFEGDSQGDADDREAMKIEIDTASVASSLCTGSSSVYSFDAERDGRALLRHVEGRLINAQSDLYFFPVGALLIAIRLWMQQLAHVVIHL